MKKIFTKMKQFFGLDEQENYDMERPFEEEEVKQQPQRQPVQQPVTEPVPSQPTKKTFRFPLIEDEVKEQSTPTQTPEKKSAVYQDPQEDETLRLPKHLPPTSTTLDVEVSGIRQLLEKRGRQSSHQLTGVVRMQREERSTRRTKNVTRDEAVFLTNNPSRPDVVQPNENPEFINPLQNKKRFTPTHVPSPVYGFQEPRPIRELLKEERKADLDIPVIFEAEEVIPTPLHEEKNEQEEHVEPTEKQLDSAETMQNHEEIQVESSTNVEPPNETVEVAKEPETVVNEQSFDVNETPQVQDDTVQSIHRIGELQLQNVTFENSTVHIGQIHVEPSQLEQPIQKQQVQEETANIPQEIPKPKVAETTGSKLPFNVLMLKSDKEKIQATPFEAVKAGVPKTIVDKVEMRRDAQNGLKEAGIPMPKELQDDDPDGDLATKHDEEITTPLAVEASEMLRSEQAVAVLEKRDDLEDDVHHEATQQDVTEAPEQFDEMERHLMTNYQSTLAHENEAEVAATSVLIDEHENQAQEESATSASHEAGNENSTDDAVNVENLLKDVQTVEEMFQPSEVSEDELPGVESVLPLKTELVTTEPEVVSEQLPPVSKATAMPYEKPSFDFLVPPEEKLEDRDWMEEQAAYLVEALQSHQIQAHVESIVQGPAVTQFEITVAAGTKVSKVRNLSDDIKLALAAKDIRIDAPIPGKRTIGIEIPNRISRAVRLSEVTDSEDFKASESPLEAALGLDLNGKPVSIDLRKMPHGLIAGATGSGKSVCINSILVSLLYKADPHELKLMLIDPKMVELAPFNKIPHLVSPVITDVKAATAALKWAVDEMERRYALFMHAGVRDITRFNSQAEKAGQHAQKLPYLLIVIDELADLMMMSPADVEEAICRIAQKARACGIHLIVATQRPSVDVITGLIKSNIPTRIAFAVSSAVDSRTILDGPGAERLLGRGDMLYLGNGMSAPIRLQGTFVTDDEIEEIIDYVRSQGEPNYMFQHEELLKKAELVEEQDELFEEVCRYVFEQGSASTSAIQRRYHLGYNRAARLVDMLERNGFVSEQRGSKPREVFITQADLDNMFS